MLGNKGCFIFQSTGVVSEQFNKWSSGEWIAALPCEMSSVL